MPTTIRTGIILLACLLNILGIAASGSIESSHHPKMEKIEWNNSLILPSANETANIGVAGIFSGFIGDYLVIAGGANFPDNTPWRGGHKTWWSTIYYINVNKTNAKWTVIPGGLPKPLAYGCSIELPSGVLCIGGCDSTQCYKDVFLIQLINGKIKIDSDWPSLPTPLANATASLLNNKIYIAGGQTSMKEQVATKSFFVLDLSNRKKGWQELSSWPGEARGYAVSASQSDGFDQCFYLFSGRDYKADGYVRVLTDGYVYNPRLNSWKKLKPQFPVMAGTAIASGANHILFLGGVPQLIPGSDNHPGFDHSIRLFHTITQSLIVKETIPYPIAVTTSIARKGNSFYISSGEIKPGIRTPNLLKGTIVPFKKGLGLVNIIVIVLYFVSLAWIGYYFSKRQKNTDDYFKGGGRIPWWAVGLSIFGTNLSAITFMSIPAKAYATDWSYIILNVGIVLVVPLIIYLFIPFYRRLNVTTAYEYLEQRFNAFVRLICSVAFILYQIGRMGIVLYLPAIALNVVTGFDISLCIGLMGILSLMYTMMGGIEAVVWTDALQVVVLLGGALLVVIIAMFNIPDGFSGLINEATADSKFNLGSLNFDLKQSTLWTVLIASCFTNITTYGTDQTMVQRYMTTATEKQARKSVWTNALLCIPSTLLFFLVGTVLYVYYKHSPADLSLTITDGDAILPWYIYSQLPQGVVGLLISGIFAAAMSTLSSSMNSAATAYTVDIHSKITKDKTSKSLNTAKMATLIFGIAGIAFAYMMTTWEIKSLWDEFNKILGIVLGSLGGLFLLGMITRKANAIGAICGIIGSIFIQLFVIQHQSVHLLLYTTTGFVSCFLIGYIVSWIIPVQRKDIDYLTIYKIFSKK